MSRMRYPATPANVNGIHHRDAERDRGDRAAIGALDLPTDEFEPAVGLALRSEPGAHVKEGRGGEKLEYPFKRIARVIADHMIHRPREQHAGSYSQQRSCINVARTVPAARVAGTRRKRDDDQHRLQSFAQENAERVEEVRQRGVPEHFDNDSQFRE